MLRRLHVNENLTFLGGFVMANKAFKMFVLSVAVGERAIFFVFFTTH